MSKQINLEVIDPSTLAEITGGNSYVRECYRGAIVGSIAGSPGGPKGILAGGVLGCLGGMAANAYARNT